MHHTTMSRPALWRRLLLACSLTLAVAGAAGCVVEVGGEEEALEEEAPEDGQRRVQGNFTINGYELDASQQKWVLYIADKVLGSTTQYYGSHATALDRGAAVAWWALKEGVMELSNPLAYSNCHYPGGDKYIGAMTNCPYSIWQVGLAGIQVNDTTTAAFESIARKIYPSKSISDILRLTATAAGQSPDAVAATTGSLRRSWLARNAPVAFVRQWDFVHPQCVTKSRSWCYGSWYPANRFASSKTVANRVRSELRALLAQHTCPLVPGAENALFKDMAPGSFAYDEAIRLFNAGVTSGCRTTPCLAFCPAASVTRGQMAVFLARAAKLPVPSSPGTFKDVPAGSTYHDAVSRIAAAGITQGCNPPANDMFCPTRAVTRGQMAAFLARAANLPQPSGPGTFKDVPAGSTYHDAVSRIAAAGITKGCNPPANDMYCPDAEVTRAQVAVFLTRAFGI